MKSFKLISIIALSASFIACTGAGTGLSIAEEAVTGAMASDPLLVSTVGPRRNQIPRTFNIMDEAGSQEGLDPNPKRLKIKQSLPFDEGNLVEAAQEVEGNQKSEYLP